MRATAVAMSRRAAAAGRAAERQVVLFAYAAVAACVWVAVARRAELLDLSKYESSPVDWCERNFAVHSSIAEFWNSASSIPIALVAAVPDLFPLRLWLSDGSKVRVILLLLVLIGVGSTYFHATLSVWGQVADGEREGLDLKRAPVLVWLTKSLVCSIALLILCSRARSASPVPAEMGIVWIVLYAAIIVMPRGQMTLLTSSAFEPAPLGAFLLTSTLLALFFPLLSHVVVLSCAPLGLLVLMRAYQRSKNAAVRARFFVALRLFGLAVLCWLIDKFACSLMQAIGAATGFQPQLHALWHLVRCKGGGPRPRPLPAFSNLVVSRRAQCVSGVAYICVGVCAEWRLEAQGEGGYADADAAQIV